MVKTSNCRWTDNKICEEGFIRSTFLSLILLAFTGRMGWRQTKICQGLPLRLRRRKGAISPNMGLNTIFFLIAGNQYWLKHRLLSYEGINIQLLLNSLRTLNLLVMVSTMVGRNPVQIASHTYFMDRYSTHHVSKM